MGLFSVADKLSNIKWYAVIRTIKCRHKVGGKKLKKIFSVTLVNEGYSNGPNNRFYDCIDRLWLKLLMVSLG